MLLLETYSAFLADLVSTARVCTVTCVLAIGQCVGVGVWVWVCGCVGVGVWVWVCGCVGVWACVCVCGGRRGE